MTYEDGEFMKSEVKKHQITAQNLKQIVSLFPIEFFRNPHDPFSLSIAVHSFSHTEKDCHHSGMQNFL